jgi:hypothetical protein
MVIFGNVLMNTTAEHVGLINADRAFAERGTLTLAGHVRLAIDDSDVEADQVTIRALDGRPLDLNPASRTELEGRRVEITMHEARITSAYDPRNPVPRAPLRP